MIYHLEWFLMLITIVHTTNYGKVVLHKYPYSRVDLEHEPLEKLPTNDILETITDTFGYCITTTIQLESIKKKISSPLPMDLSPKKQ